MAKVFRSWDVDQGWLLPLSLHEFVPLGHMAHLVSDTVREALDLSAILDTYTVERGYPPYHPGMMVALLLYGYSRGLYSSHAALMWLRVPLQNRRAVFLMCYGTEMIAKALRK
ncbi:hypothetical protein BY998_1181 [Methylobacterium sp. B4]|nr:hypothetical protein BY998_1181 [Methylobacterium sp. B4]